MLKKRVLAPQTWAVLLALGLMTSSVPSVRAGDDIAQSAVTRAHDFFKTDQRGRFILGYLHFGSAYGGHVAESEVRTVSDRSGQPVPGHFALVYRFTWGDDGKSDVAFLCDARGIFYKLQVVWTNAVLNQPFLAADLSIQLLGNVLIQAFKENMKEDDRRQVQALIDNADSKGMLQWSLVFQQALGR